MYKTHRIRTTSGSWDVEKVHAVLARRTFRSQNVKNTRVRTTFGRSESFRCRFAWQAQGTVDLVNSEQNMRFCSISKNDGRRGTFEEDLQRCIFRGRRITRDMFIRAVTRSGRWFLERGCILEHQIFRFAEMILRDRCSTSYDLASLFRGRRSSLDRWTGKVAKRIGTRPSALHSTFHVWTTSRRIALFLMLSTLKMRCLAELLRFWYCQVQKLRMSRWIAAFLMLSSSKTEDVSQNSFVFKLADR